MTIRSTNYSKAPSKGPGSYLFGLRHHRNFRSISAILCCDLYQDEDSNTKVKPFMHLKLHQRLLYRYPMAVGRSDTLAFSRWLSDILAPPNKTFRIDALQHMELRQDRGCCPPHSRFRNRTSKMGSESGVVRWCCC